MWRAPSSIDGGVRECHHVLRLTYRQPVTTAEGLVITTTHYDSLKALTESDPRFRNAGMEYDLQHLRPTFRLRGVSGCSARQRLRPDYLAQAAELRRLAYGLHHSGRNRFRAAARSDD